MLARASIISNMNKLPMEKRVQVVAALVEGNSLRATARMTGVARMTIEKLLRALGSACARYQNEHVRNLATRRVQCDEIWAFCYAKRMNVTPEIRKKHPDAGDVWTWTAIDADSKLVLSWAIGSRDAGVAYDFMQDVASRLKHRVQMTTDSYRAYLTAVDGTFGIDIDYATLQKMYKSALDADTRYSPAKILSSTTEVITGTPNPKHISTSYVERQNLTMRMHMRRFTRLTNGFSKKVDNLAHAVALHFMWYNFGRIHQTLRVTPAMEAGVSDHVWSVEEIVLLAEQ